MYIRYPPIQNNAWHAVTVADNHYMTA